MVSCQQDDKAQIKVDIGTGITGKKSEGLIYFVGTNQVLANTIGTIGSVIWDFPPYRPIPQGKLKHDDRLWCHICRQY